MPTGHFTQADEELLASVAAEHGLEVSPRQLQEWRRAGLVAAPAKEYLGRGRGTRSHYPAEAADDVARVAATLEKAHRLPLVVLGLFGVGVTAHERAVRAAYRWQLQRTERAVRVVLSRTKRSALHPEDRREYARLERESPELSDAWVEHADEVAEAERARGDDVTNAALQTTGKQVRDREAIEILTALEDPDRADVASTLRSVFGATDDHIEALHATGGPVSFSDRRLALDNTSYKDLVSYRDLFLAHQHQAIAVLPAALRPIVEPTLGDPLTGGLMIASVVLDVAAMLHRDTGCQPTKSRTDAGRPHA